MVGDLLWDCPVERENSRCARLGQVVADVVAWVVGERVVVVSAGVTHSRTVRWMEFRFREAEIDIRHQQGEARDTLLPIVSFT
jgi:hypothetical protein